MQDNKNIIQPKNQNVLKPQDVKQREADIIPDLGKFHVYEDTKAKEEDTHMDRSQTSANLSDGAIR
jgi:hypothetical protein